MNEIALQPTARTTVIRGRHRAVDDRAQMWRFLDEALVAHLGVIVGDHPVVLPVAFVADRKGPDAGGSLYLHASSASRWLNASLETEVCVTITELDGLVLARTAFDHSMNYRSVVVIGRARPVTDPDEKVRSLDLLVDHVAPGRSAELRASTRKELAATAVFAVPLIEASMKARAGGPGDDNGPADADTWAGHVPLARVAAAPVPAAGIDLPLPPSLRKNRFGSASSLHTGEPSRAG